MSSGLLVILIIFLCFIILLTIIDIVIYITKKKGLLPQNKFCYYISQNLIRINAFCFLLIFTIIWIMPLIIGAIGSFTSSYTFETHPGQLIPEDGFTFENYLNLFDRYDTDGSRFTVERWVLNSL